MITAAAILLVSLAFAQEDLTQPQNYRAYRASSNNPDLNSNDDSWRPIPGETSVLADLKGPGEVTHIWVTVAANEYAWPRLLRLRVYYDGSTTPSVDAPVGDFFASGHGFERDVNSLMVRNSSHGRSRNCYWRMPFRKSVKITITNEGRRRVSNLYFHVDWRKLPSLPPATRYFHALYRQSLPAEMGKPLEILNVKGQGHYVGTVLSVIQNQPGWFGEGDDFFYVDGVKKADIEGTGTEDYFNDAWSLREADSLYIGVPIAEGTNLGSRMTAYRWHIADPIPFTRDFRFDFEHAGWTYNADGTVRSGFEERADLFSTVAFWYQLGIAQGLPEPPYGSARLPHGNAQQIEVEQSIAAVKTEHGKAEVQKEVFWGKDLLFLNAEGVGSRIEIPFTVEAEGLYEVTAQVAHAPDYGVYQALLDGKPVLDPATLEHEPGANTGDESNIDGWNVELYVAQDHLLGWKQLAAGAHTLTLVCIGKNDRSHGYHLGVDTLILAHVASPVIPGGEAAARLRHSRDARQLKLGLADPDREVRAAAAWSIGQMGATSVELVKSLDDPDPVVRGLIALALVSAPVAGADLTGHLKDPDDGVRMVVAKAIAHQGQAASAAAVPALIEAAGRSGEHVHVLRALADAMGAAGGAARPALPVLRTLERIPRARWNAAAAIRRIEAN